MLIDLDYDQAIHLRSCTERSDIHKAIDIAISYEPLRRQRADSRRTATAAYVSTPSSAATYKPTCPGCHRGDYGPTAAHDCGVW